MEFSQVVPFCRSVLCGGSGCACVFACVWCVCFRLVCVCVRVLAVAGSVLLPVCFLLLPARPFSLRPSLRAWLALKMRTVYQEEEW